MCPLALQTGTLRNLPGIPSHDNESYQRASLTTFLKNGWLDKNMDLANAVISVNAGAVPDVVFRSTAATGWKTGRSTCPRARSGTPCAGPRCAGGPSNIPTMECHCRSSVPRSSGCGLCRGSSHDRFRAGRGTRALDHQSDPRCRAAESCRGGDHGARRWRGRASRPFDPFRPLGSLVGGSCRGTIRGSAARFVSRGMLGRVLLFVGIGWAGRGTAAEWFVAPGGDDAGPGTEARPFATLETGAGCGARIREARQWNR